MSTIYYIYYCFFLIWNSLIPIPMEKSVRLLLVMTVSLLVFSGCVRNTIDDSLPAEIEGLTVPADFNWSSLQEPTLTIIPEDTYDGQYYYLVEVFDGNPITDSNRRIAGKRCGQKESAVCDNLDQAFHG